MDIKQVFFETYKNFTKNNSLTDRAFAFIIEKYSEQHRHYHNIKHIKKMLETAFTFEKLISDIDIFIISIFYHDIIYNVFKNNNEEKSAMSAVNALSQTNIEKYKIQKVSNMIIRTKNHTEEKPDDSQDLKLFLDTDLIIFSAKENEYLKYAENIRKEYKHVPKIIFNKKRKEILENMYSQIYIYKTDFFKENFETKAKNNLLLEIKKLSK